MDGWAFYSKDLYGSFGKVSYDLLGFFELVMLRLSLILDRFGLVWIGLVRFGYGRIGLDTFGYIRN